jgi:hypothetical protein
VGFGRVGTLRVERRMGIVRLICILIGMGGFNSWSKVCVFECPHCMGKGVMRGKLLAPRFIRFVVTLTDLRLHLSDHDFSLCS